MGVEMHFLIQCALALSCRKHLSEKQAKGNFSPTCKASKISAMTVIFINLDTVFTAQMKKI